MLRRHRLIRQRLLKMGSARTTTIVGLVSPHLRPGDRVIDIGCGTGSICQRLRGQGYDVVPVDVKELSLVDDIAPLIYDGNTLPFADNSFDVALLLTVLHHTENPTKVLAEATRVARRVVVIEDTCETARQRFLTHLMDSLINVELLQHPHTNKSLTEWEQVFADLRLKLLGFRTHNYWRFFTNTTFYLESESDSSHVSSADRTPTGGVAMMLGNR